MAQRNWEVDTVRAQAKFLSITGAMKTVYYDLDTIGQLLAKPLGAQIWTCQPNSTDATLLV